MSLAGSRTIIRRSAEQWQEILQRFEHSGQDPRQRSAPPRDWP